MATLYSSGASTPDATEATAGKVRLATAAEATAGTNDTTAMTPLKVADAIAAGSGSVTGALVYRGSYDASTQTPDLTTASKGDFYIVSVAGALDGVALSLGDHVVFNQNASSPVTSAMFDVIDNTDAVASVNGQTGVITLTASDVSALASGDNISELTNDSGYLTSAPVSSVNTQTGVVTLTAADVGALASGDNVSSLTNDSGYLTSAPVSSVNTQTGVVTLTAADVGALASGDNVSTLTNDAGYLTSAPVSSVNSLTGAVSVSANDLAADHTANNYTPTNANIDGHLSGIDSKIATFAPVASPAFTGTPTADTASAGTNTTQLATTAFVTSAVAAGGGGISNIVEDTTPQLGGDLDPNGNAISGDLLPSAANTHALGSADAEWSDLYLGDSAQVNFGIDQDIQLVHEHNVGLALTKNPGGAFYPRFTIRNQDSGSLSYGELQFDSQSATPANNDFISRILAQGRNSVGGSFPYAKIETRIADVTDSTEAGRLLLRVGTGGTPAGNTGTDALDIYGTSGGDVVVKIKEHDGVSSGLMLNTTLITSTAAELNLLDGGATVGASITIADTDGFVVNDGGVSKLIPALDLKTYAGGGGGGGTSYTYSAITTTTAAQAWYHYSVNTSGGAVTLNLPALSTLTDGDEIRVKLRVAGNDLTIDANSTETIDSAQTQTLSVATSSITLVAGSTEWEIV